MVTFVSKIEEARIEDQTQRKAEKLNLPYLDLKTADLDLEALRVIPEGKARQIKALVFQKKVRDFSLATVNPETDEVKQLIKEIKKFGNLTVYLVSPLSFERFLENYQFIPKTRAAISGSIAVTTKHLETLASITDVKAYLEKFFTGETDISEVVVWLIAYAIFVNASDLHLEPREQEAVLRYRVDGILYPVAVTPAAIQHKINDRIKLISRINLNIRDIPQDGRFSIKLEKFDMEVRVSTIPGPDGENIVMRFLNPNTLGLQLEDLGMRKEDEEILRRELKRPNGLILNTGPTGSGKTTTLYACLKRVATTENKVITIEDPIEYHLPGIEQTQTDAKAGYTFASGLRAILRQDPDIILVGEIRDQETAEIAMHASLTGHLVFSTLHTNNAAGAIPRLLDFAIKPEVISATLNLIIAQRLVRKLCPSCSLEVPLKLELKQKMEKILVNEAQSITGWKELLEVGKMRKANTAGCEKCGHKGYKGRLGVFELLVVSDEMQTLIHQNPDEIAVKNLALKSGTVSMAADAVLKILSGVTDLEEVEKMVGPFL